MNTDTDAAIPDRKPPDLSRLPDILEISVHMRRFDPPRRTTRAGVDHYEDEAIQVSIRVSEPFQIRALGPVLWIGDVPLTEADGEGDEYRFFAFERQTLDVDAPIALSWSANEAPRRQTSHRYRPPKE